MTKQTISALILSAAFAIGTTAPVRADVISPPLTVNTGVDPTSVIVSSDGGFDSNDLYTFVDSDVPASGQVTIVGTFSNIIIPTGDYIAGITISGVFGNEDGESTALSAYFLGFTGDETAVNVANCDVGDPCVEGQTTWNDTSMSVSDLATLAAQIYQNGSLDFTYTWNADNAPISDGALGYLQQGIQGEDPTISVDVEPTPEPATLLICFGGFLGIATLRRFRKV